MNSSKTRSGEPLYISVPRTPVNWGTVAFLLLVAIVAIGLFFYVTATL